MKDWIPRIGSQLNTPNMDEIPIKDWIPVKDWIFIKDQILTKDQGSWMRS